MVARSLLLLAQLCGSVSCLRFSVGDKVECHLGESRWERGTVVQLHVENDGVSNAYLVSLDSGGAVTAPHDDDVYIRASDGRAPALRFAVGDRVECNLGEMRWERGTVAQLHIEVSGALHPYMVNLDSGGAVTAPQDGDMYIRPAGFAPQVTRQSARQLRFAVGDRVECHMGGYWAVGTILALNHHEAGFAEGAFAPYQVALDSGGKIFAPEDTDGVIRRIGTLVLSDAALRFRVGDRVECSLLAAGGGVRWDAGVVVALRYHEPRFGEGGTVPYQVKLDDGGLIYTASDEPTAIRRASDALAAGAPPEPAAVQGPSGSSPVSKMSRRRVGGRASTVGVRAAGSKLGSSRSGKFGRAQTARPQSARPPRATPAPPPASAAQGGVPMGGEEHGALAAWRILTQTPLAST